MSRIARVGGIAAVLTLTTMAALSACTPYGATLSRPSDPVVMSGAELIGLTGAQPQHIVGFAWDGSSWHQIPVQVDERDLVSPGQIYHLPADRWPSLYGSTTPYLIPVYTPPAQVTAGYSSAATYTPPDSNPTFDADDELSFLADSTGKQADPSTGDPAGVDAATRQQVRVTEPLAPDQSGYVYLYRSATLTGGSAGTTGVVYDFSLDSGAYLTTYKMGTGSLSPNNTWGFNPEHSVVTTPSYTQTFADRWLNDGITITKGDSTAVDLLDRAHYYATGSCGRSEDTFDGGANNPGEGAFVANISGPVRAIRSYIGANSYKYTVNTDVFYPSRQDTVTELRGHAGMPGYGGGDDFTTGMTGLVVLRPRELQGVRRRQPGHRDPDRLHHGEPGSDRVADGDGRPGHARHHPVTRHRHRRARRHDHLPGPEPGRSGPVHGRRGGVGPERRERRVAGEQRAQHRSHALLVPQPVRDPTRALLRGAEAPAFDRGHQGPAGPQRAGGRRHRLTCRPSSIARSISGAMVTNSPSASAQTRSPAQRVPRQKILRPSTESMSALRRNSVSRGVGLR